MEKLLNSTDDLTRKQLGELLPSSTRTVDRLVARGLLPRPLRLGRGTVRWRRSDLERHLRRFG